VIEVDDITIVTLFSIAYSISGVMIAQFASLYNKIAELNKKIGEIDGKLEMVIKYINNNKR
jgi:hypothetical protein